MSGLIYSEEIKFSVVERKNKTLRLKTGLNNEDALCLIE